MQTGNIKPYQYVYNQQLIKSEENSIGGKIASPAVEKQKSAKKTTEELMKEKETYVNMMKQEVNASEKQMEAEKERLEIMITCLEISRRITGGDKVPPADHKYLMKHDSGLYARSISLRLPKNDPFEYKRISKEEDANKQQSLDELTKSEHSVQEIPLDIKV